MNDTIRNYLAGLQSGYRLNEIDTLPNPDSSFYTVAPANPYRVALYLYGLDVGAYPFSIRLPSGLRVLHQMPITVQLYLTWTHDTHLIYQEWGIENNVGGHARGFEVVKV